MATTIEPKGPGKKFEINTRMPVIDPNKKKEKKTEIREASMKTIKKLKQG
jgi:hypothetical protein